jgi:hypothetical protein
MKKEGYRRKTTFKKQKLVSSGFAQVMGQLIGSTEFCRVVALTGLLTNPNRSSHPVDLSGRSGFNNNVLNS